MRVCGEGVKFTVEGGGNGVPGGVVGPNEVMMGYGGAVGTSGAMGPSSGADVLGSTGDYSPQGTPNSLGGHPTGSVDPAGTYNIPGSAGALTTYSPQDSPASSAGASANNNEKLPTFGFTQEQVACVCEVSPCSFGLFVLFFIYAQENSVADWLM